MEVQCYKPQRRPTSVVSTERHETFHHTWHLDNGSVKSTAPFWRKKGASAKPRSICIAKLSCTESNFHEFPSQCILLKVREIL